MTRFKPIFVGLIIFGVVFLVYFGTIFVINKQEIDRYGNLDDWQEATATVFDNYVNYNDEKSTYQANVDYNYTVNGQTYNRTSIIFKNFSNDADAQAYLDANYPIGAQITIYHHPKTVGLSAINPEKEIEFTLSSFKLSRAMTYTGIAFLTIGIPGLIYDIFTKKETPETPENV